MKNQKYFKITTAIIVFTLTNYFIYENLFKSSSNNISTIQFQAIKKCPEKRILTAVPGGNTGNKILEYLSILAVSNLSGNLFQPFAPNEIISDLNKYFVNLSLPSIKEVHNDCPIGKKLKISSQVNLKDLIIKAEENPNTFLELDIYSFRYIDIINNGISNIRTELQFKDNAVKYTMDFLNKLKIIYNYTNPTFVGIHYRGTDYIQLIKTKYNLKQSPETPIGYYERAMKYYKAKYKEVIFILASVDYKWISGHLNTLKNYMVVNNPNKYEPDSKLKDMALLCHCNHTIVNLGTFAAFISLYHGGETIVYNDQYTWYKNTPTLLLKLANILDNWHVLD